MHANSATEVGETIARITPGNEVYTVLIALPWHTRARARDHLAQPGHHAMRNPQHARTITGL